MIDEITEAPKTDFYLRLPSEADMPEALSAFYKQDVSTEINEEGLAVTVFDGDPYLVKQSEHYAIDIVGTIFESTGDMLTDGEGNEYPKTVPLPGWHVNLRLIGDTYRAIAEELDHKYGVTPNPLVRAWL